MTEKKSEKMLEAEAKIRGPNSMIMIDPYCPRCNKRIPKIGVISPIYLAHVEKKLVDVQKVVGEKDEKIKRLEGYLTQARALTEEFVEYLKHGYPKAKVVRKYAKDILAKLGGSGSEQSKELKQ